MRLARPSRKGGWIAKRQEEKFAVQEDRQGAFHAFRERMKTAISDSTAARVGRPLALLW